MTLSLKQIRCKVTEWCENPPWSTTDLDEQTLSIDCDAGTLAISNGNDVPLAALGERLIYRRGPNVNPGVNNREWHDTLPAIPISDSTTAAGRAFRLGHDFTLTPTTVTTTPAPVPNDTNNTAGELDIQVLDTFITVPAGGVWIRLQGGSEGYWAIEAGFCCGPRQVMAELGYQDRVDNNAIVGPVFFPEGEHALRIWNIDAGGSNSSHIVRYSTDGTTFTAPIPAGVEYSLTKRGVECETVKACDPIPEGWADKAPVCEIPPEPDPTPVEPGGLDADEVQALIDATPHPVQDICTGPWAFASNPTGWLGITAGTRVPAAWTYVVPQFRTIATFTAPDCITDATLTTDLGHTLHYMRDARIYHLGEVRYLVNGAAVRTYTSRAYPYSDERTENDATEPLQYEWKHVGMDLWRLLNLPANAVVEVQVAHRVREVAPQDTPWSRAYVGLRSQASMHTTPRNVVVGRI